MLIVTISHTNVGEINNHKKKLYILLFLADDSKDFGLVVRLLWQTEMTEQNRIHSVRGKTIAVVTTADGISELVERRAVPDVSRTQAGNDWQRILRGGEHQDEAIGEEPEVPWMAMSKQNGQRFKLCVFSLLIETWINSNVPVVLNMMPSSVESVQGLLSLTDVRCLADVDASGKVAWRDNK